MKARMLWFAAPALLLANAAGAQTKISGTAQCGKPEPEYTIDVGDRPGHSMGLQKVSCTWTKPMEMEGTKTKDGTSVVHVDMTPTRMTGNGMHVGNMENGDKQFVSIRQSGAIKDGKPQGSQGTWSYTGGTGKFKGLKGKGTYKVALNADGTATVDVEGEYEVPAAAPAKAK